MPIGPGHLTSHGDGEMSKRSSQLEELYRSLDVSEVVVSSDIFSKNPL